MQDVIKREITIQASKQRIYQAIANPDQVVKWFPETIEGRYAVGEQPIFGFGEFGKNRIFIVAARPHEYFSYRWVPDSNQVESDVLDRITTLVEFHIAENPDGSCLVRVTETGFARLPSAMIAESYRQNSSGWDFMLDRLQRYFEGDNERRAGVQGAG